MQCMQLKPVIYIVPSIFTDLKLERIICLFADLNLEITNRFS